MEDQWTCAQCKHQNPGTMQFCPHCGAVKSTPMAQSTSQKTPLARGDNRRWWIGSGIILILICAILAVSGGLLLGRRVADNNGDQPSVVETTAPAPAVTPSPVAEIVLSTRVPPADTDTLVPTDTPAPRLTATTSGPSLGDRLALSSRLLPPGDVWNEAIKPEFSDGNDNNRAQPQLTVDDTGRIYVTYVTIAGSIFLAWSDDNGQTWTAGFRVSEGLQPKLVVFDNKLYLFFLELQNGHSYTNLRLMISSDEGKTWSNQIQINEIADTVYGGDLAKIEIQRDSAGILYTIWSTKDGVSFSKSEDNGQTWSKNQNFQSGMFPKLVIDNLGTLYIIWQDSTSTKKMTIYFSTSSNGGQSWLPSILIVPNDNIFISKLAIDSFGTLYVLLITMEPGVSKIYVIKSTDGGQTWSNKIPIGSDTNFFSLFSKLAVDTAGNLYVLWLDTTNGIVYFSRSLDGGTHWSPSRNLHSTVGENGFPIDGGLDAIATKEHIYAIWNDGVGGLADIYFTFSDSLTPEELAILPTPAPPTATPKPVAVAPPAPSSCPAEGVQITAPRAGAYFTQRYNYIIGTANINRFHHWKLEYSTNPNGGWQYLFDRDYPVNNDKLMMLDASTVPMGPYGLRLTVVDETGNYPEPCVVWFTNGY